MTSLYESPNPHRLYRDTRRGYLAGVCAGIGDYFGVEPFLIRLGFVAGLLVFTAPALLAYVVLAVLLKPKPPQVYRTSDEEAFWRTVSTKPDRSLAGLGHRFGDMEKRVRNVEAYVTSKEFELNRAIRDLDR